MLVGIEPAMVEARRSEMLESARPDLFLVDPFEKISILVFDLEFV